MLFRHAWKKFLFLPWYSKMNISLRIDARRPLACRTLSSSPSEARLPTGGAGSWAATDGLEAVPPKLTWGLAAHIEARESKRMNLEKERHDNNGLASHTFKFQRYLQASCKYLPQLLLTGSGGAG